MVIGGVLYIVMLRHWVDGIWAMVIGSFLFSVATGSYPRRQ